MTASNGSAPNGGDRRSPAVKFWLWVVLGILTASSGVVEVSHIVAADHLPQGKLAATAFVLDHTHFFKVFLPVTIIIYVALISRVAWFFLLDALHAYAHDPFLLADQLVVVSIVVGLGLLLVNIMKHASHVQDAAKDPLLVIGTNLITIPFSLFFGLSLGQERSKRGAAEFGNRLEAEVASLKEKLDSARHKIVCLHKFIYGIKKNAVIPPELDP